jgi:hypothetical protein
VAKEFNSGESAGQDPAESSRRGGEQTAATTAADLKERIKGDLESGKEAVTGTAGSAIKRVNETVNDQTDFAARQVGGVATVLRKVGEELESGDQPQVGRYAKQIGESVQAIAKKMEGQDLGKIAGMVEDFGRKQPVAFLGVAALAGLAASRFLTASRKRSDSTRSSSEPPGGAGTTSPKPIGLTPTAGGPANG